MDDRVAKLESDVGHIRSDISRIEGDVREIRGDVKDLRGDIADLRTQLKDEVSGLKLAMEKMRSSQRLFFLILLAAQLAVASGAPYAIASALRFVRP